MFSANGFFKLPRLKSIPVLLCLAMLFCAISFHLRAQTETAETEVWLVTYGPGEIYWQRFGHNGIWIRDSGLGLDHVFNFGFFDFEQDGFLLNFLQGRLMYFSAAQPAEQEFAQYINENRSIRAQRLSLSQEQALFLTEFLVNEVQPENREYLYDYYKNNCSTKIRDAIDLALGGTLHSAFESVPGNADWRGHTRRLTQDDFWLYLGLELGLGATVDKTISRWDEFFIPGQLADGVAEFSRQNQPAVTPLIAEEIMLYESTASPPAGEPGSWWYRYLALSFVLLGVAVLLCRFTGKVNPMLLSRVWLLVAGLLGVAMIYFWFFTNHEVASNNLNLTLFNPLWLLVFLGKRFYPIVALTLVILAAVGLGMMVLPPHQYTADVIAAFLPLNIAVALVLRRNSRREAKLL
jgi:hypothetical protein